VCFAIRAETKLAFTANRAIEAGVTRPPVADIFRRRKRLIHPLWGRIDFDEMHDVRHVLFL
jgi:hypothetical protein